MIANSLSHLLALLRKQIRLARQVRVSHRLIIFVLLSIPLLFLMLFNSANEVGPSQAVTALEGASILEAPSRTTTSDYLGTPSELLLWWRSLQSGFVRGFWGTVLALPISALLWCLVVLLAGAFRKLLRNLPQGQIVRRALLKQEKAITSMSVFLLLVVLMPTVILLLQNVPLSASEFVVKYVWELFVSVMLVALTVGSWKLLVGKESLGDMLVALDHDEITQSKAEEVQQIYSLEKWWGRGDETGWCELWDVARFAGGLHPAVYSAVKEKLQYLEQTYPAGPLRVRYAERLQLLLSNGR